MNMDWQTIVMVSLVGAVSALLTGKTFRRILLLPFEWIARKTRTTVDNKLVEEARKDLGVPDATLPEEEEKK